MNVISMFDGAACALEALKRAGFKVDNYWASEIDKHAMTVAKKNHPEIQYVGDALTYDTWNLDNVTALVGGSPCQDLSRLKSKEGKGLDGEKSKLFYTYYRALEKFNPQFFMLENVVPQNKTDVNIITKLLGVEPILIDSGNFSAQNRPRLYWTNIPIREIDFTSELVLSDIMQPLDEIEEKHFIKHPFDKINGYDKRVYGNLQKYSDAGKLQYYDIIGRVYSPAFKAPTLTAVAGGRQEKKVMTEKGARRLTPLEYERLQTLPDGYTEGVADSHRYRMLGNGWTVDVIKWIFEGMKE